MRRVKGRIVSMVNGESIICVAINESKWKEGSKMQHNSEGSNALYSTLLTKKKEDQGQHPWLLYKDLLKRFNSEIWPYFSSTISPC